MATAVKRRLPVLVERGWHMHTAGRVVFGGEGLNRESTGNTQIVKRDGL
jgi:hypothetical protein